MEKDGTLIFNLAVPINKPSEEDIELFRGDHVEAFIKHLMVAEYLSAEEAAAYTRFIAELGGSLTFLLDEFLKVYREHFGED